MVSTSAFSQDLALTREVNFKQAIVRIGDTGVAELVVFNVTADGFTVERRQKLAPRIGGAHNDAIVDTVVRLALNSRAHYSALAQETKPSKRARSKLGQFDVFVIRPDSLAHLDKDISEALADLNLTAEYDHASVPTDTVRIEVGANQTQIYSGQKFDRIECGFLSTQDVTLTVREAFSALQGAAHLVVSGFCSLPASVFHAGTNKINRLSLNNFMKTSGSGFGQILLEAMRTLGLDTIYVSSKTVLESLVGKPQIKKVVDKVTDAVSKVTKALPRRRGAQTKAASYSGVRSRVVVQNSPASRARRPASPAA